MLARLVQHAGTPNAAALCKHSHVLCVLPAGERLLPSWPGHQELATALTRRRMKAAELGKTPVAANLEGGALAVWVMADPRKPAFESHTCVRTALQLLMAENPQRIAIVVLGEAAQRRVAAEIAVYCGWINGYALPERKKKASRTALKSISLYGYVDAHAFAEVRARAEGNALCRELTVLPPNELTPAAYRTRIGQLARQNNWFHEEYDLRKLRKMGAGAFCAVAQGSVADDAAIVHLRYAHAQARQAIALVGKGICFDTGGHNLKPARHMYSMHEDMNGSAVALGLLHAAARTRLPLKVDCWLAIAQNHISPSAYKQNDVVTALNGTTIEIMHTDAEGRMVLADTLSLATRGKPDLLVDFATLTGSMHVALGTRYSGVFATSASLAAAAVAAGNRSGERVCVLPMDADYDSALDSTIADVKQCTLDNDADHILAARFLHRFVGATPWLHVDLSASSSKGGLGAVATDITGFGVGWGLAVIADLGRQRK